MNPNWIPWLTVMTVLAVTAVLIIVVVLLYKKRRAIIIHLANTVRDVLYRASSGRRNGNDQTEADKTEPTVVVSHGLSEITEPNLLQPNHKSTVVSDERCQQQQINTASTEKGKEQFLLKQDLLQTVWPQSPRSTVNNTISVMSENDAKSTIQEKRREQFRLKPDLQQTVWPQTPLLTDSGFFESTPKTELHTGKLFSADVDVCYGEIEGNGFVKLNSNETPQSILKDVSVHTAKEMSKESGIKRMSYSGKNGMKLYNSTADRSDSIANSTLETNTYQSDIQTGLMKTVVEEQSLKEKTIITPLIENNHYNQLYEGSNMVVTEEESMTSTEERRIAVRKLERDLHKNLLKFGYYTNSEDTFEVRPTPDYESLNLFSKKNDSSDEDESKNYS